LLFAEKNLGTAYAIPGFVLVYEKKRACSRNALATPVRMPAMTCSGVCPTNSLSRISCSS